MKSFSERFNECIDLFNESRDDKDGRLSMYSFAANKDGQEDIHLFQGEDYLTDIRSISKVVTSMVLGCLISDNIMLNGSAISLNTNVEPLLISLMPRSYPGEWKDVRIVDLLNNTIGHENGFLFRRDLEGMPESDYLNYIFTSPIQHLPGTHFSYSNVGPFLFSVIVQTWLGKPLYELAQKYILNPLEIEGYWRSFGDYTAGCTGLSLRNSDLIKLGCLMRDGGSYLGTQIISRDWIDEMRKPRIQTPKMYDATRVFPKFAYGLGLWISNRGSYYCDGTNGQYLIVVDDSGFALSTTGNQPDMKPITRCMIPFLTH